MKKKELRSERLFLAHVRHSLLEHHLPRIASCLKLLPEKEVWWRANRSSNSLGNLILHLEGNVRQWIISGLGGEPDRRQRELEFSERGPISRRALLIRLEKTLSEASQVINRLSSRDLGRVYTIQGFRVTGIRALCHVMEHFAYHAGQIIFVTKLKLGRDLGFTRLPSKRVKSSGNQTLPAI